MTDGGPTYYDRPVIKEPVWIWAVPVYFWIGGAAGAAAVLGATAQAMDGRRLRSLVGKCRRLTFGGTAAGSLLLVYDLGRPERFVNMLRVFRPTSAMSMGSWVLAASSALSAAAVASMGRVGDFSGLLAGAFGLPLAGYTAVLLSDTAVPLWQETRRTLPLLFVASAASSAASLLDATDLDDAEARIVRLFGSSAGIAEVLGMRAVEKEVSRVPEVERHLHQGLGGGLWNAARSLVLANSALTLLPGRSRSKRLLSAVLGTAGALGVRFALFHAGKASARDPQATFAPQRERLGR